MKLHQRCIRRLVETERDRFHHLAVFKHHTHLASRFLCHMRGSEDQSFSINDHTAGRAIVRADGYHSGPDFAQKRLHSRLHTDQFLRGVLASSAGLTSAPATRKRAAR